MNLLAAAAAPTQPAPAYNPAYQNQAYQNTTVQQDKPAPKASFTTKALVYGNLMFNLAVVVIIVVMVCKFVWAFEKIARAIEKGIVIKKDDTTTT
jgi:hypothetical protein